MVNAKLQVRILKAGLLQETYKGLSLDFPILSIVKDNAKFWIADLVHHVMDRAHVDFLGISCLKNILENF